jgi:hypothetical protein
LGELRSHPDRRSKLHRCHTCHTCHGFREGAHDRLWHLWERAGIRHGIAGGAHSPRGLRTGEPNATASQKAVLTASAIIILPARSQRVGVSLDVICSWGTEARAPHSCPSFTTPASFPIGRPLFGWVTFRRRLRSTLPFPRARRPAPPRSVAERAEWPCVTTGARRSRLGDMTSLR